MRVLLVALNRETHPYPVQPIGLAYVAAAAREAGHETTLLDLNLRDDPLADLEQAIDEARPQVIGLGLRNIDNCAYPRLEFYLPWAREVADRCRACCDARLIVGGSGFAVIPGEILEYLEIDVGILGDGEQSLTGLLAAWQADPGADLTRVNGLALRAPDGAATRTPSPAFPFGQQRFTPARELLDMDGYQAAGGLTAVQTKRGCSLRCSYCTYPMLEGRDIRHRDPELVGEELERLQEAGIEQVFFTDNVFNNPVEHAVAICRQMVERQLTIRWTAFFNPAFITEELVEWATRAGCSGFEFGSEGGTSASLRALRKGFSLERLVEAHRMAAASGLPVAHYLMVGSPGETLDSARQGLDLIASLEPTATLVSTGIRIYPTTAICETARAEGYDVSRLLIPQFYFPPAMRDDPAAAIETLADEYPQFRFEGFHKRPTLALLEALRRRGHEGPVWTLQALVSRLSGHSKGTGQRATEPK